VDYDPLIDSVVNGRYHIVRQLGEGGMSVVYEVQHVKLKRQFALKKLLPALMENEEAMIRFEREAELLASLRHPHVVDIIDWDVLPDGTPFMVLEFLHGAHVRVRLDRAPMPWEAIARIGDQAMSALALAHRIGITHRDLKPENLFISIDDSGEERVKLLDFGVSKMRGLGRTTGQHAMLGTPSYMSPEQAQGQTDLIGPSTDVWAMGTILYELATQRVAFTGETLVQTVVNITSGRPQPMSSYRPDTPAAFAELIDRAISPDPERRITTIEELRSGLKASLEPVLMRGRVPTAMGGVPPLLRPPTPVPGGRVPTPPPGGRAPTPVPGLDAITAAPGVSLATSAAPGGGTVAASSSSSAGRTSIWIIASTALIAIAATVAVMFAMQ
jgi:eukaryotic-like serine/threonine-protein kinase